MNTFIKCAASLIIWGNVSVAMAQSQSFRILTDIHFENQPAPQMQSLTVFANGVYYDFSLDDPSAATVIDPANQSIWLLDGKRHIKTIINTAELMDFVQSAQQQVKANPELTMSVAPELAMLVAAADIAQYDDQSASLTVGNDQVRYRASTQRPPTAELAQQYADFANWSSRLNAKYPPRRPPYVRMRLNDELGSRGLLPAEIEIINSLNGKVSHARCRLIAKWQLNSDDEARVQRVAENIKKFSEVKPAIFFAQQEAGK